MSNTVAVVKQQQSVVRVVPTTLAQPKRERMGQLWYLPAAAASPKQHPIVWVVASLVLFAMIVAVNIAVFVSTAQDAHRLSEITVQQVNAERTVKVLERNMLTLNSPQNLAVKAQELGMVQNTSPAYLRLSDGVIMGSPNAATELVSGNTVQNDALAHLEATNEKPAGQVGVAAVSAAQPVTTWEGLLPVPQTH
ncbi:hypothetical protein KJY77_03695 [Canibacter sp. lx-72]|uniref:hypothetical protein n=1 Tax=Canibacter zhuwentaonis TaxID=2837491 RepID=UPI001BDCBE95|nr:hypothetical protein [Canibacter zhuwentaonis]MBT1018242.1 hypothetical protein [Canibacter zhuwentaonis]MBT1035252.1 hypothetical protein [Canibacter zhuwentaonis]